MPPAAHAVLAVGTRTDAVWAPDALLRAYLDAVVDALVRAAHGGPALPAARSRAAPAAARLVGRSAGAPRSAARSGASRRRASPSARSSTISSAGASPPSARATGCAPASGSSCPMADGEPFTCASCSSRPTIRACSCPRPRSWKARGRSLEQLGRAFRDPQESLLEALGRAARLFPPLARALDEPRPESIALDPATAWTFLGEGAATLAEAGFGVIVPGELTAAGQRRLRLRMRVGGPARKVAGVVGGAAGLGLDELLARRLGGRHRRRAAARTRARGAGQAEGAARPASAAPGSRSIRASSARSSSASPAARRR